jgi:hypothetical protein
VLIKSYFNKTSVHSSVFIGNSTSSYGRYTSSKANFHSFIYGMFLISYMHEPGWFIRYIEYVTGWRTEEFCFRFSRVKKFIFDVKLLHRLRPR